MASLLSGGRTTASEARGPAAGSGLQANHERGMKVSACPRPSSFAGSSFMSCLTRLPPHPPHRLPGQRDTPRQDREDQRLIDTEQRPDQTTGEDGHADADERDTRQTCPECGGAMIVIETFTRGQTPNPARRHGGCRMIHPSHPAPQSRDVGPAHVAISPKSAPRQVHDGQHASIRVIGA